jgi:hypothetical protein
MSVRVGFVGGARPIQPFEGSRPWEGIYAYSIGVGVMREAVGTSAWTWKKRRQDWFGCNLRVTEARLGTEVGNGVLVWGQEERTTATGGATSTRSHRYFSRKLPN